MEVQVDTPYYVTSDISTTEFFLYLYNIIYYWCFINDPISEENIVHINKMVSGKNGQKKGTSPSPLTDLLTDPDWLTEFQSMFGLVFNTIKNSQRWRCGSFLFLGHFFLIPFYLYELYFLQKLGHWWNINNK